MPYPRLIDISFAQPVTAIDWQRLHDLGVAVLIRLGQADYQDNLAQQHIANAIAAKVLFGVYWFNQPDMPAAPQLQAFLTSYKSLPTQPCVIFLDVEDIYVGEGKPNIIPPSVSFSDQNIHAWLSGVETGTGFTPGIYTRADYWNSWTFRSTAWAHWPLWIATWLEYAPAPRLPLDWTSWVIWQYEGGLGRQDGVTGPCDLDVFSGTDDDMLRFFGITPPVTPTLEERVTALEAEEADLKARVAELEKVVYKVNIPIVLNT